MYSGSIIGSVMFLGLIAIPGLTRANEQMTPLAISGNWVAMAHSASMTAAADVCVVANSTSGVAFRSDDDGVELRVANSGWALPTSVHGEISLSIGQWKSLFEIGGNTNTSVAATVSSDVIAPMFTAMDNSSVMAVTVGKAKPMMVSLTASTRATNAFRTCAHIKGSVKSAGANPFE